MKSCNDASMTDDDVRKILFFDEQFKNLPFYKSEQSPIQRIDTGDLYMKLYNKIKNYDKFKDNLRKIIKKLLESSGKKQFTDSEYETISYCYFLALQNVYYKLISRDRTNGMIKQINISIIELLARLLDNFSYLYDLSCENIFIQQGTKISFKSLNENSLEFYNGTISSYNDFMTVYYNIISFINYNCEKRCKFSSDISKKINELKKNNTELHQKIFSFMNRYGESLKNKFAEVKQQPTQLKQNNRPRNNRPRNNRPRNNTLSSNEQSSLLHQDELNSPKKSSCSIL
jgi:hypothetical protein